MLEEVLGRMQLMNGLRNKNHRYRLLATESAKLPLNTNDTLLDKISIEAKYVNLTSKKKYQGIEETISSIDKARGIEETGLKIYELITNKKHQYNQRFNQIQELLESENSYDDLAVTLLYLQKNSYLKRKSKKDQIFAKRKEELEQKIKNKLYPPTRKRSWSGYTTKIAAGLVAASAIIASIPTSMYSFLG